MQLATLTGHTYRVLYLAISPDGQVAHLSTLYSYSCLLLLYYDINKQIYEKLCNLFSLDLYMHALPVAEIMTLFFLQTIVTGAGDETLRFWNVFPSPKSQVMTPLNVLTFQWKMIASSFCGLPLTVNYLPLTASSSFKILFFLVCIQLSVKQRSIKQHIYLWYMIFNPEH